MVTPALDIDAVGLGHPGAPEALGAVRIVVSPGERVAVLGGNGAGKTTLLKVAVGLLRPRQGAVRVFGARVASPTEAVRAGAGLVLQNPDDQLFGATVVEDAIFGPANRGAPPSEARRQALAALECTGMARLADRPVQALSFGEKKRAAVAGVLAMEPSLVLLDEPTAGLDASGEAAMIAVLDGLAARGATVVVATHAVDLVPSFAERAVVLGEGRVLADGPVHEVFGDVALLARAHLRTPWVTRCPRCGGDAFGAISPRPARMDRDEVRSPRAEAGQPALRRTVR